MKVRVEVVDNNGHGRLWEFTAPEDILPEDAGRVQFSWFGSVSAMGAIRQLNMQLVAPETT